jgi:ATP-dependent DNA helicase RecQ
LDAIYKVLDRVTTLDEAKRLVGTSRRMLDEDPANLALRYISACARIRSAAEGDNSVIQECRKLFRQLSRETNENDAPNLVLALLKEVQYNRFKLQAQIFLDSLKIAGSSKIARCYLQEYRCWPENIVIRKALTTLLLANIYHKIKPVIPDFGGKTR